MPERKDVYSEIDIEREYQNYKNPITMSIGEEIALALKYTHNALDAWSNDFEPPEIEALAMFRSVAAVCVRAMENHGAPKRETK